MRAASSAVTGPEALGFKDQPLRSVPKQSDGEPHSASASPQALFVIPTERGDGFRASIRGHMLELADPGSAHGLAPTPDDLFVASVASDCAWFVRRFLRACDLDDDVTVCAGWRTRNGASCLADIDLTVTVPGSEKAACATLATVLENRFAARSPNVSLRVCIQGS